MKKKRYKYRKKKKSSKKYIFPLIISLVLSILAAIVFYWIYQEIDEPKFAKKWSINRAVNFGNINLPEDEGYHSNKMEWWYYNGHLVTKSGKKYSFHFTTFLLNNVMTHTVFHSSLSDHQQGLHYIDQNRTAGNSSTNVLNGFYFKQNNWLMKGSNGHDRIKVENDQFAFDLKLESTQSPIYHGNDGIISLGSNESSYYYSRTRMNTSGILKIGSIEEPVTGVSWFDHQWGDFSTVNLSWDWFSIQLDNGIDLMLYQLRDKSENPVLYQGSFTKLGKTEILTDADFIVTPKTKWNSKKTTITYPVSWDIKIPKKNIDINIQSILKNSEFDAKITTYNTYWEGASRISGTHTGKGFVELNGIKP